LRSMSKDTTMTSAGADLAAENAALKARLAVFEAAQKQEAADEIVIKEKMSRGLRREQAKAVVQRQRDFDARKRSPKP
jgi:hypothetical protein